MTTVTEDRNNEAEDDQNTNEATATAETEAENEQDKVKPVIYIGLVLTALFSLGNRKINK